MAVQPENLIGDVTTRPAIPIRIQPYPNGGAQSRKFAKVSSDLTLLIGTPVAYVESLDAWVAWDPNTGSASPVNEVQEITFDAGVDGGTFRLGFKGEYTAAIAFNASAATIETAFEGLASVGAGNGTVSGGTLPGTPVLITFTGDLAGAPQELVELDDNALSDGGVLNVGGVITRTVSGSAGKQSEVQVVTLDGTPTGGTFTLSFDGEETSALDFDASAAEVEAALEALAALAAADVSVAGSAGGPWTVTFATAFANADLPQMTADGALLTPAGEEGVTVTTSVQGSDDDAPAGDILGFIAHQDAVLSTVGESWHIVMRKGTIHFDDIQIAGLPGSPTSAQLAAACRDLLSQHDILVDGLSGVL